MLGFDDYNVAWLTLRLLNSQQIQNFINSICFYDAKRAINKDLLMRINLLPVINLLDKQSLGLTKDEYERAARCIIQHGKAVMAQQCIHFENITTEDPSGIEDINGFNPHVEPTAISLFS